MWVVGAVVTGMAGKTGFWGFFDAILAELLGFRAVFCKYGSTQCVGDRKTKKSAEFYRYFIEKV